MRILLQRSKRASVSIDGAVKGQIESGLVLLVGIGHEDTESTCRSMAAKILDLRIFEDSGGKMNLSFREIAIARPNSIGLLVISQFTLYADTRKGRRPSFTGAAESMAANQLVTYFGHYLRDQGADVSMGEFGKHMLVALENDGPVTIWIDSSEMSFL